MISALLLLTLTQEPALAPADPFSFFQGTAAERTLKVFGRVQSDWLFTAGGEDTEAALATEIEDGHEFRRVRLGAMGDLSKELHYKAEFDFAGGSTAVNDVFMEFTGAGYGAWKLGHFKEPFGMDALGSANYITFLERSTVSDAFAPSRNVGLALADGGDAMNWTVGAFREADSTGATTNEAYSATGRFVYRPWIQDGGKSLLHVGVAGSWRNPDGTVSYKANPENHLVPAYFTSAAMMVDSTTLLGLEVAFQEGPFHGMFEWQMSDASASTGGTDASMDGMSVQAAWFATGESRGYKAKDGVWDRVQVTSDAGDGGIGAFELAARFSTLDLTEAGATDDMTVMSLALNWYLNSYARMMFDVTKPELDDADDLTIFALRAAFDF